MQDAFGRKIDYARVSLTQRCNLRCAYCRPQGVQEFVPTKEWTLTQLTVLFEALARLRFGKLRFTGGEPSLRTDLEAIVDLAHRQNAFTDIAMTSNGQHLAERLPKLQAAGLMRLNLSLDTCRPQRYQELTGGHIAQVYAAMDAALALGMPVKINALLMRGWNENELDVLIALAKDRPVQVRFIERMPFGPHADSQSVLTEQEVVRQRPYLRPVGERGDGQSARLYCIEGYKGLVGFISPMSRRFCAQCNRLRFTIDGACRPCLGNPEQIDLTDALAQGVEQTVRVLQQAIAQKPAAHRFGERFVDEQGLCHIGG